MKATGVQPRLLYSQPQTPLHASRCCGSQSTGSQSARRSRRTRRRKARLLCFAPLRASEQRSSRAAPPLLSLSLLLLLLLLLSSRFPTPLVRSFARIKNCGAKRAKAVCRSRSGIPLCSAMLACSGDDGDGAVACDSRTASAE